MCTHTSEFAIKLLSLMSQICYFRVESDKYKLKPIWKSTFKLQLISFDVPESHVQKASILQKTGVNISQNGTHQSFFHIYHAATENNFLLFCLTPPPLLFIIVKTYFCRLHCYLRMFHLFQWYVCIGKQKHSQLNMSFLMNMNMINNL